MQTNVGWSHELTADTVVSVDYVNSLGRDLNYPPAREPAHSRARRSAASRRCCRRAQPEHQRQPSGAQPRRERVQRADRQRAAAPVEGRRLHRVLHAVEGRSTIGNAADELNTANIQDREQPVRRSARSSGRTSRPTRGIGISLSAVFQLPGGFRVAPLFFYRSALPVDLIDGRDLNLDGDATDIPAQARTGSTGFDQATPQLSRRRSRTSARARPSTAAAAGRSRR